MTTSNSEKFAKAFPLVWDKILEDKALPNKAAIQMDLAGNDVRKFDNTKDAISTFLNSLVCDEQELKKHLGDFFRWNKLRGPLVKRRKSHDLCMSIVVEGFLGTCKIAFDTSQSSLERSVAFQDEWEKENKRSIDGGDALGVVSNEWSKFCRVSKVQWCFEISKSTDLDSNKASLNCRLSLGDETRSKEHLLIKMIAQKKHVPTALDGGSNLYKYWIPGGQSAVMESCIEKASMNGLDEFVFNPTEKDKIQSVGKYMPCQNFTP